MKSNNVIPINPASVENPVSVACRFWREAKLKEERAKAERLAAEETLLDLLDFDKLEGSSTSKTEDGLWKVTLTAKLDRKLDEDAWRLVEERIPAELRPVKAKLELDLKGLKWLEANEPEIYALLAPCLTVKPAKTAVKVEFLGAGA